MKPGAEVLEWEERGVTGNANQVTSNQNQGSEYLEAGRPLQPTPTRYDDSTIIRCPNCLGVDPHVMQSLELTLGMDYCDCAEEELYRDASHEEHSFQGHRRGSGFEALPKFADFGTSGASGSGYGEYRRLIAKERKEEDVAATHRQIRFKHQDVASTGNALRIAPQLPTLEKEKSGYWTIKSKADASSQPLQDQDKPKLSLPLVSRRSTATQPAQYTRSIDLVPKFGDGFSSRPKSTDFSSSWTAVGKAESTDSIPLPTTRQLNSQETAGRRAGRRVNVYRGNACEKHRASGTKCDPTRCPQNGQNLIAALETDGYPKDSKSNDTYPKAKGKSDLVTTSRTRRESSDSLSGQDFLASGTSESSIKNPKLLEAVEDAIRRLILPELTALKSEQSLRQQRSASVEPSKSVIESPTLATASGASYGVSLNARKLSRVASFVKKYGSGPELYPVSPDDHSSKRGIHSQQSSEAKALSTNLPKKAADEDWDDWKSEGGQDLFPATPTRRMSRRMSLDTFEDFRLSTPKMSVSMQNSDVTRFKDWQTAPGQLPPESPLDETWHETKIRNAITTFRGTRPSCDVSSIIYNVHWELPHFMSSFFESKGGSVSIHDVLTITGNDWMAYAANCAEYMCLTFPQVGLYVLNLVQQYWQNAMYSGYECDFKASDLHMYIRMMSGVAQRPGARQAAIFNRGRTFITVEANYELQVQTAMAISWLCATFRSSLHEELHISTVVVESSTSPRGIAIMPGPLSRPSTVTAETNQCWHKLFKHSIVALDYPIPKRKQGIGLEISFTAMTALARSLNLVEYESGLVAEGLRTLLIPVKELKDDYALQWHLEEKYLNPIPGRKSRKLHAYHILLRPEFEKRHKELNPELLKNRRCFLGWTESAGIIIGMKGFSKDIGFSGASACVSTGRPLTYTLAGGTSGLGIFGIMPSISLAPSSAPARQLSESKKDLDDALQDSTMSQVLVYDNVSKIAWMVPQTYIILYLLQVIVHFRQYSVHGQPDGLPEGLVGGKWDVKECLDAIYECLKLDVQKRESSEQVSNIVTNICARLDIVAGKLLASYSEARKGIQGPPKYIFGYELLDIARNQSNPSVKQSKVQQPWAQLAEVDGVVLFCSGFGQAIMPKVPRLLCSEWRTVPRGKNYLATTGNSIRSLLERTEDSSGSRISDFVDWKVKTPLVQSHKSNGSLSVCFHTQSLVYTKRPTKRKTLLQDVEAVIGAGFIFERAEMNFLQVACEATVWGADVPKPRISSENRAVPHYAEQCSPISAHTAPISLPFETSRLQPHPLFSSYPASNLRYDDDMPTSNTFSDSSEVRAQRRQVSPVFSRSSRASHYIKASSSMETHDQQKTPTGTICNTHNQPARIYDAGPVASSSYQKAISSAARSSFQHPQRTSGSSHSTLESAPHSYQEIHKDHGSWAPVCKEPSIDPIENSHTPATNSLISTQSSSINQQFSHEASQVSSRTATPPSISSGRDPLPAKVLSSGKQSIFNTTSNETYASTAYTIPSHRPPQTPQLQAAIDKWNDHIYGDAESNPEDMNHPIQTIATRMENKTPQTSTKVTPLANGSHIIQKQLPTPSISSLEDNSLYNVSHETKARDRKSDFYYGRYEHDITHPLKPNTVSRSSFPYTPKAQDLNTNSKYIYDTYNDCEQVVPTAPIRILGLKPGPGSQVSVKSEGERKGIRRMKASIQLRVPDLI